jgi:hypothetical protein
MKMIKEEYPYNECSKCKTIADCPHPDVELDGMGSPIPPDVCPHFMDIMKSISKEQRIIHKLIREN